MDVLSRVNDYLRYDWSAQVFDRYDNIDVDQSKEKKAMHNHSPDSSREVLVKLYAVSTGVIKISAMSGDIELRSGDWVFVRPEEDGAISWTAEGTSYIAISFFSVGGITDSFLKAMPSFVPQLSVWEQMKYNGIFHIIHHGILSKDYGSYAICNDLVKVVFIKSARQVLTRLLPPEKFEGLLAGMMDKRISQSIFDVLKTPEKQRSLISLSEDCGMSRTAYATLFLEIVGITPFDFIRRVRMSLAVKLFLEGKSSVSDISYKVGYASESAFYKAFQGVYGTSPRDYVNSLKKERVING